MSEVTRILSQIESGDLGVADQLLPLVYEDLRRLAARRLATQEKTGRTLSPTALVHEAYLRLVSSTRRQGTGNGFQSVLPTTRICLLIPVPWLLSSTPAAISFPRPRKPCTESS